MFFFVPVLFFLFLTLWVFLFLFSIFIFFSFATVLKARLFLENNFLREGCFLFLFVSWKEHEDGTSSLCSVFVVFYMSSISFAGKFKFSELTYGSYGIYLRAQIFVAYARKNYAIVESALRCDNQKPKHNSVKWNQLLSLWTDKNSTLILPSAGAVQSVVRLTLHFLQLSPDFFKISVGIYSCIYLFIYSTYLFVYNVYFNFIAFGSVLSSWILFRMRSSHFWAGCHISKSIATDSH